MQDDGELYLSARDLGARYNVHPRTPSQYWIKTRGFPEAVWLAGCKRWRLSDVIAWEEREIASNREVA